MFSSTLCASRPRSVGLALAIASVIASFAAGVSLLVGATASSAGSGAAAFAAVAGDGLTAGDGETSGDGDGEEGFGLGDTRCAKAPARELTDSSKLGQQLPVQLPSLSWKVAYAATSCCYVMHSGRLKAQLRCEACCSSL